ncbi:MAG TPA: Ig-like domain-containing protein [Prolixibacteraceae bacterium]|nr:Ig-like domain-containing protein [Prolixibacteraceae bacterium]HPS13734.1 Ig-like domain-containing protein [Prolixibacteraceae bacterium]
MTFSSKLLVFISVLNKGARKSKILLIVVAFSVSISLFLFNSCANQGVGPSGGPRDSIPPVVITSIPASGQKMYDGKEIVLTFNEYVVASDLSNSLIISPPLAKKPEIKTSGKSVIVKIPEDLIPDRTYSVDFQNGIKDYTEGNVLKGLRILFSTGNQLDSLQIGGYVLDAFTHLPVPNTLVTLYTFDNDSVFQSLKPDFIARSNDEGFFLFDNLPPDHYKLYGLTDIDKNLFYSQPTESIAFCDSMITPSARYIAQTDTTNGKDSVSGFTEFFPKDVTILLFQEKTYNQYIVSSKRETEDKCLIAFNESVDSFRVDLVKHIGEKNWNEIEYSANLDTVSVFIVDSLLAKTDTIFLGVNYLATDTLGNFKARTDTIKMLFNRQINLKDKKKDLKPVNSNYFNFSSNLVSSNFDLNKKIILEAPSPLKDMEKQKIGFYEIINDSTKKEIDFGLLSVPGSKRKYQLSVTLAENTKYLLSIDSSAICTMSGIPNAGFQSKFSTQKADFYGSIILSLKGVPGKGKLQLIKYQEKGDKEEIVRAADADTLQRTITFDYLKPDKYVLKFFNDINLNGKWDTGNLTMKLQSEPVFYFPKVINVKSNWEIKENWEIKSQPIKPKKIVDESKKEEKKSGK